jgi:hypothetical protein
MSTNGESDNTRTRGTGHNPQSDAPAHARSDTEREERDDRQHAMGAQPSSGPNSQADGTVGDNTVKDPDEWKSGGEPMTGAQRSYLKTLSDEAKEPADENLTKAEASKRIDELRERLQR